MIRNCLARVYIAPSMKHSMVSLFGKNSYQFNMLTDKMADKQDQKQRQQVKDEINHMANKPSFTFMDYKLRINDQLIKVTKGLKAKISAESTQRQKALLEDKKVLDAMFQQQLIEQVPIKANQKRQISLVTQTSIEKINEVLKGVNKYKKMHLLLRGIKQRGEQLPQDMQSLQYLYSKSGLEQSDPKNRYQQYRKRSRIQRGRLIKWNKL